MLAKGKALKVPSATPLGLEPVVIIPEGSDAHTRRASVTRPVRAH